MSECWKCKQKKEYFIQKLNDIRNEAKKQAQQVNATQAIYREGSIYYYCDATKTDGRTVIEYVSIYN